MRSTNSRFFAMKATLTVWQANESALTEPILRFFDFRSRPSRANPVLLGITSADRWRGTSSLVRAVENFMPDEKFSEKGIIPEGTIATTLGIDSQSDGFYFLLACWGRRMECWLPLTGRITGDMRADAVWKALLEVLTTTWLDKDGNGYRPVISALDIQGDHYPQCLEFVRAHGWLARLRAVRGYAA